MKRALFYGWYVLSGAFIVLFFSQGARSVFGLMFKPIAAEMGWSRGTISAAVFLNMIVFALMMTVFGRIYDRYGARSAVLIATAFMGIGHIAVALVNSPWQFFVLYGVVTGIGFGGASVPLFSALMAKWFERHRGLVVSLALAGGCLGQYVLVPLTARLLDLFGWRWVFVLIGATSLVVSWVVTLLWVRDNPADLGLSPLGAGEARPASRAASWSQHSWALPEVLRSASFWLFLVVMAVCGGGDYLVLLHLVPMVTDQGIAVETASRMLAWFGLLSLAGVLITGRLVDRLGDKLPLVATFVLRGLLFLIIIKSRSLNAFYIFSLGFGFTLLITGPITVTLMGRLYGLAHLGLITGVVTTVHHLSGGLFGYLGGVFFDHSGNYDLIIVIYGIACVVAVVCGIFIRQEPPLKKGKRPDASTKTTGIDDSRRLGPAPHAGR